MRFKARPLRRWQFSVGVIAPAAAFLVVTAALVMAFVVWSTNGVDQAELAHEQRLAVRAIDRQIAEIPRAQESIAIWDDAVELTRVSYDKAWIDNNLGIWMWEYYGFDGVIVLDDRDAPIYTMVQGEAPAPGLFERARGVIAPLLDELRKAIDAGAIVRYQNGETTDYPHVLDLRVVSGRPAVVSILPITSQTGEIPVAPGTEYLHVAIDYLDEDFARAIADNYSFARARFATTPSAASGNVASHPLFDRVGRLVTFFEWSPRRPGADMLGHAVPILVLAFAAAGLLVAGLVAALWRSTSTLEAERVDAKRQAAHDALTGLPNRTQFESQLARVLANQRRHTPDVSLLLLDLDRFKHVNDTLGHSAGDALIRAVSQRLDQLVGPGDVLARLGGDEFAIIHAGPEGRQGAERLANTIVAAVTKPFDVNGSEAFVGVSIGLALAGKTDRDQQELARKADIALYEAKGRGRGRLVVYEEAMNEQLQDRHLIEGELRDALQRGDQLSVAFQPLYSARTGEIAGAEALVRWNHPRLGQISPARFIPIAESCGLIEAIGEFVLVRACRFGARWPGKRMAVNISPAQLRNPRFAERVFDLMVENAMRPSDLELEITENILLDSGGAAGETLEAFRKAGIRVALDDFGTGYSSLNYLKRYPVDCIKIDRSFVAQLAPRNSSAAIVQAMVTLAHALDIEVTAEGVETHEQMAMLRDMGCNLLQGFLLSPPATEEAIEAKFRRATERRTLARTG